MSRDRRRTRTQGRLDRAHAWQRDRSPGEVPGESVAKGPAADDHRGDEDGAHDRGAADGRGGRFSSARAIRSRKARNDPLRGVKVRLKPGIDPLPFGDGSGEESPMNTPNRVKMVEVGPRDGLQNEPGPVSDRCQGRADRSACAMPVCLSSKPPASCRRNGSRRWPTPREVMARIRRKPGVSYPVLVPNLKGLEGALAAEAEEVAVFAAATESFSKRNTNCSIAESFERFAPVRRRRSTTASRCAAMSPSCSGARTRAMSPPQRWRCRATPLRHGLLRDFARRHDRRRHAGQGAAHDRGGRTRVPVEQLAGHFHDTYGQALANILAVLELGVAIFDSFGRRAGRLSLRAGRHRQRGQRRRAVSAGRHWASRPAST